MGGKCKTFCASRKEHGMNISKTQEIMDVFEVAGIVDILKIEA